MTTETIPGQGQYPPASWHAWQYPPKPPPPVTPPTRVRARCWLCGRFAARSAWYMAVRQCHHCDTTWHVNDGVKFVTAVTDAIWRADCNGLRGLATFYCMEPGGPADMFDDFIDHSKVYSPSPA
jgi:hypothetical protein